MLARLIVAIVVLVYNLENVDDSEINSEVQDSEDE